MRQTKGKSQTGVPEIVEEMDLMEGDGGPPAAPEEIEETVLALGEQARMPQLPPARRLKFTDYTWTEIDESTLPQLAALDPESRRYYLNLGHVPGFRRYDLGTFRVSEFHTVQFEAIPALGEVGCSEVFEYPAGAASPLDAVSEEDSLSPLLRFLQLTEKNVPVPLVLTEFDDRSDDPAVERALAGRQIVDQLDSHGRQASLVSAAQPPTSAAAVWTCFNGGDDAFSAAYCESKGIWYCDNEAWLSLVRSSGDSKRYVSHSRIAACSAGSGHATYAEHQFRFWNWWKAKWEWTTVQYPNSYQFWQVLTPGQVKYWKHTGSKKRRRKVKIWTEQGNYFRAWSAFYN